MENIRRHTTPKSSAEDQVMYQEWVVEDIEEIESEALSDFESETPKLNLGSYAIHALGDFDSYQICDAKESTKEYKLLSYTSILLEAYYDLAYNVGSEVELTFRKKVTRLSKPNNDYIGFNRWSRVWGVFFSLRNRQGIDILLQASQKDFENAQVHHDQLEAAMFDMMSVVYSDDPKAMNDALLKAMELTDITKYKYPYKTPDFVLNIYEPLIRVYNAALRNDEKSFNEELYDAVSLHKEYWGSDTDNRKNSSDGWISWLLLAPAALANDSGLKMNFKTDYLPDWLVSGEFPNQ